jgi:hypothetical protein
VVDASVNWQAHKLDNKNVPSYNSEDPDFKNFVEVIAVSTSAFFVYSPCNEDIKRAYAKAHQIAPNEVSIDMQEKAKDEFELIRKQLGDEMKAKPIWQQKAEGDASETGLIKFI